MVWESWRRRRLSVRPELRPGGWSKQMGKSAREECRQAGAQRAGQSSGTLGVGTR